MESKSTSKKEEKQNDVFAYHEYIDIVEKQKHQFDSFFALKLWRPNPPHLHPEVTKAITDKILASPRMKDVINQVMKLS